MKIDVDRLLAALGSTPGKCPLCGGPISAYHMEDHALPDLRGSVEVECGSCAFRGDATSLAARVRGETKSESLRWMRTEGIADISAREMKTAASRLDDALAVSEHMARCVAKLRAAPERCNIRAGLSVSSIRQLPPDTGMHIISGAPRQFALLSGQRYTMVPMVLYAYRFNGDITCIDAQNPSTREREHRLRVSGDYGVYLGDYPPGEVPASVLATSNPRTAGQLYGAMRAESSKTPPVIGVAGFPLPPRFSCLSRLYLLDASDSPLPLEFALRCATSKVVYGDESPLQRDVRVVMPNVPASDIRAENVRTLLGHRYGVPLRAWIRDKILAMSGRLEEVASALLSAGITDSERHDLAACIGDNAPSALIDTILLPTTVPDDVLTLGNGRMVKNTPVGIYAAANNRKTGNVESKSLLSNVGIEVTSRVACDGYETAVCRVSHPDPDVPDVVAKIPSNHWANCDAIAGDIRAAYSDLGRTPYVAMYRLGGYSWMDIMQLLGSHCPVQDAIHSLGMTADRTVNLPNACIHDGRIDRQTRAGDIPDCVMHAYSAVSAGYAGNSLAKLRDWMHGRSSIRKSGLTAGLLHALYSVTGGLYDRSGSRRPPPHLLFVETEPGIWDGAVRDLALLFSGSDFVRMIDYADPVGFLSGMAQLGTLPLIARVPSTEQLAGVLSESPVGLIAIADPITAMSCSGRANVSFVLPNDEAMPEPEYSFDDLSGLREVFVGAITELTGDCPWRDAAESGPLSTSTPCLTVAGSIAEHREDGSVYDCLMRMVKARFPGVGMTGLTTFFNVLHQEYAATLRRDDVSDIKLAFVHGVPPKAVSASFNENGQHVFIMSDVVLISRHVVQLINREKIFMFDAEQLSNEMDERGILLHAVPAMFGIDERRVWAIPREAWDENVARTPGFGKEKQ